MHKLAKQKAVLRLIELLRINKAVLISALVVSIVSSLVFAATTNIPMLTDALRSSGSTPWGVVTSIFLHGSDSHLLVNLVFLWLWTTYIIFPANLMTKEQMKNRLQLFVPIVFGAAIISNLLWIVVVPNSGSLGASGLVFAFAGAALGFSLMNMLDIGSRWRKLSQQIGKRRLFSALLSNIPLTVFFIVLTFLYTDIFLAKGSGVNVFAHGVSFLIAMFAAFTREYLPYMRAMINSLKIKNH